MSDHSHPPSSGERWLGRWAMGLADVFSARMRCSDAQQLLQVQRREAANGMPQVGQLFEYGQTLYVGSGVEALPARCQRCFADLVAALPHPERGHRHMQHVGYNATAVTRNIVIFGHDIAFMHCF